MDGEKQEEGGCPTHEPYCQKVPFMAFPYKRYKTPWQKHITGKIGTTMNLENHGLKRLLYLCHKLPHIYEDLCEFI